MHRVTRDTQERAGVLPVTLTYTYDALTGRLVSKNMDAESVEFRYDSEGRLSSLQSSQAGEFNFTFDEGENLTDMSYPNGIDLNIPRDELGRPLARLHGGSLTDFEYGYRPDGNLLFEKHIGVQNTADIYNYDSLKHVTGVKYKAVASPTFGTISLINKPTAPTFLNASGFHHQEILDLDLLHNRKSQTLDGDVKNYNQNATVYMPDPMNKIQQVVEGVNTVSLTYDPNHNVTTDGGKIYLWTTENRLKEVRHALDNTVLATYEYDPMGRRVKKVVGTVTTYYFYDGWQCVMEKDSLGEVRTHTFGLGLDDILSTTVQNGDTVYFHKNYLGSVTSMTDNTGSVLESVRYDIHGTPTIFDAEGAVIMSLPDLIGQPEQSEDLRSESSLSTNFLYTGQRYDFETGLYYYKNRYYSPELGRFLSLDPAGEVDGMNLYAYVMGNPMNGTDPMGLNFWDGLIQGIYDILNGVDRTSETIGASITLDRERLLQIGRENEEIFSFVKWLFSQPSTSSEKLARQIILYTFEKIPECAKSKVEDEIILTFGGRASGNIAINAAIQKLLKKRIQSILTQSALKSIVKRLAVSGGIGSIVFGYQMQGVANRMVLASHDLKKKYPSLWLRLHNFHNSDLAWLFIEPALKELKKYWNMSVSELTKNFCC